MPVPDFSPGEVLTAAAMDSIGLWLVKTQTVGTGVSSVTVTDAFSADYENYLITVNGGAGSAIADLRLQIGGQTSLYYSFLYYSNYNANTVLGFGQQNQANFNYAGAVTTNSITAQINVQSPFLTRVTHYTAQHAFSDTITGFYHSGGQLFNTTSYTSFTLSPTTGTLTGGTIRVYGYRK